MEIAIIDKHTIKVKTKRTTFIIDPTESLPKTSADAILLLQKNKGDLKGITDYRLVIDGPGEYELGGVKVSAFKSDGKLAYGLIGDGIESVIGESSVLNKLTDKFQEKSIAIINMDEDLGESVITTIEPKIIMFYGEKTNEGVKSAGKDPASVEKTKKINIAENKMPEEMQVAILQ
ncbi:hypothetical protein M1349_01050 [Patescibacteria group bacterium]|nr:hypothetical protein [Patescibacteria group bacterium]